MKSYKQFPLEKPAIGRKVLVKNCIDTEGDIALACHSFRSGTVLLTKNALHHAGTRPVLWDYLKEDKPGVQKKTNKISIKKG
jgi:hypothetical protein